MSRAGDRRWRLTGRKNGPRATPAPWVLALLWCVFLSPLFCRLAWAADPFADEVVLFEPGSGAGFGQEAMPNVVLGPPRGGGLLQGALDVVSLGNNGRITLRFVDSVICDDEGPDFTVFENAFHAGSVGGPPFAEVGIVAVSQDGESYREFPYDPNTFVGLAGVSPVLSHPENGVDPTDPAVSGGDSFDLAHVGLAWAAYVRITDPGLAISDLGNLLPPGDMGGFDLDAIAAVHDCLADGDPTPTTTATPTSTSTVGEVPSPTVLVCAADCDGSSTVTIDELVRCTNVALGMLSSDSCAACDWSGDGGVTIDELVRAVNAALDGCTG